MAVSVTVDTHANPPRGGAKVTITTPEGVGTNRKEISDVTEMEPESLQTFQLLEGQIITVEG